MGEKVPGNSFGALLRKYRGVRGLTQEELAERAGLHPQEISKLERGARRAPRSTTIEFLADAMKLDAHEREAFAAAARGERTPFALGLVADLDLGPQSSIGLADAESLLASMPTDTLPERGPLPAGSRMPLAPNPVFVGRGDELLQIARSVRGGDTTVALGQVVASTGLGGLGKTQLAVEFVHRYGSFFAGGVFWLSFARADEIPLQVAACASREFDSLSLNQRVQWVKDAWQSAAPRLLVFDNCEEEALLDAWRPTSGGCRVLVTSRRAQWTATLGVAALPLDLLLRGESVELLRRYRPDLAADDPGLDALAAELGDLPLALHLAGSYLRAYRAEVTPDGYLAELRRADVLQHASLHGRGLEDVPNPTQHVQGVAQTFALCLARLAREREADRVAIALLARMAYMAPGEPVPRDLLANTLEDVDPLLRADGLRRLGAVGLVEEGAGGLRLHRLVAHFVRREQLDPSTELAVEQALINCGNEAAHRHVTGHRLATMLPHILHVADRDCHASQRTADLQRAAGLALQWSGDLRAARMRLQSVMTSRESLLGRDHPDTAESVHDLAVVLRFQGELTTARSLAERALAAREHGLGHDHLDTASSVGSLAVLLQYQGEVATARRLHERALDIRTRVAGPEGLDVALTLHNLSDLDLMTGDLAKARSLAERALTIREGLLGHVHADVARSLDLLALILWKQGDVTTAIQICNRALAIWDQVMGPKHPDTAFSLHNLAGLRQAQGDLAAARALFERVLAIRERVLGADHSDTVATRSALAELVAKGTGPPTGC